MCNFIIDTRIFKIVRSFLNDFILWLYKNLTSLWLLYFECSYIQNQTPKIFLLDVELVLLTLVYLLELINYLLPIGLHSLILYVFTFESLILEFIMIDFNTSGFMILLCSLNNQKSSISIDSEVYHYIKIKRKKSRNVQTNSYGMVKD